MFQKMVLILILKPEKNISIRRFINFMAVCKRNLEFDGYDEEDIERFKSCRGLSCEDDCCDDDDYDESDEYDDEDFDICGDYIDEED